MCDRRRCQLSRPYHRRLDRHTVTLPRISLAEKRQHATTIFYAGPAVRYDVDMTDDFDSAVYAALQIDDEVDPATAMVAAEGETRPAGRLSILGVLVAALGVLAWLLL